MHPKGHFIASTVVSAGVYAATGSVAMTAASFAGGFLIDLDHLFDYVVFHGERDLRPSRFIRYYLTNQYRWIVLLLHSYELFALLLVLTLLFPSQPFVLGCLLGALHHLALDLIFNRAGIQNIVHFYSFIYRARRGFEKETLVRPAEARA